MGLSDIGESGDMTEDDWLTRLCSCFGGTLYLGVEATGLFSVSYFMLGALFK